VKTEAPRGGGLCSVPQIFSNLDLQAETIGAFLVLFSHLFSCLFYPEADEFSLLLICTILSAADIILVNGK